MSRRASRVKKRKNKRKKRLYKLVCVFSRQDMPRRKQMARVRTFPLSERKAKRKYKKGEIAGWRRPRLDGDSADEGNDLDEEEEETFQRLCLCRQPKDMGTCKCGCLVFMTRAEWHAKKAA